MERMNNPSAEIRYGDNLFAIENFVTHPEDTVGGNLYNTTFAIRVVSGAFVGYALCEYVIKEFERFVREMEDIYLVKRSEADLNDIGWGSKVHFVLDRGGHVEISGEIVGIDADHRLAFCFVADQTCLKGFI